MKRSNFDRVIDKYTSKENHAALCKSVIHKYEKALEKIYSKYPRIMITFSENDGQDPITHRIPEEDKLITFGARLFDEPGEEIDLDRLHFFFYHGDEGVGTSLYYKESIEVDGHSIHFNVYIQNFCEDSIVWLEKKEYSKSESDYVQFSDVTVLLSRLLEREDFSEMYSKEVIKFIIANPIRIINMECVPEKLRNKINTIINFS